MVMLQVAVVFAALVGASLAGVVRRDADGEGHRPAFLEGLDDATIAKFKAIWHDHSIKGDAKDAALTTLATSVLKPDKLAEFKKHQEEWKAKRAEFEAKYAKLSPNAKAAADKLKGLWGSGLDKDARKAKKEEILKTLSDSERAEIEALHPKHIGSRRRRDTDEEAHRPAFLEGLDDATIAKFKAIWHDHSIKGDAKDAALTTLATSVLKPDKLAEFKTHQEEWKAKRAEYEAKYAKLSPNAKAAADKLKGLWGSGLDKDARKAKREEILKTLSDSERAEIDELRPKHIGRRRRDADGEGHRPAFLEGLDDATIAKFKAIWHDHSIKGDAKDAALTTLATSVLKPDKLAEFKKHQEEWKAKRAELEAKYAKLSPNAKAAADKLKGLWGSGLDKDARKAKKEEILKTLSDSERAEIEALHPKHIGSRRRRDADGEDHRPAFLEGLDDATIAKFKAIWHDHSIKGDAKDAALTTLATSVLKPDKLAEFKKHQEEWKAKRAELEAKYAKLSPNAKAAADKLKGLWGSGLDKDARKAKKEEILKTLSDSERAEIEALHPKHIGSRRRRGADGEEHEPSFMTGLDDATKAKFKAIWHDHSIKGDAKDAALLTLATSVLTPDKLAEFKTHQAEWKVKRAEFEAKYEKLSPNAKAAADKLKQLWGSGLDKDARKAKKEEILKTLTDSERAEIEALHPKKPSSK